MRVLGDRVLVTLEGRKVEAGGILLPESAQETAQRGLVTEVGVDVKDVTVGDTVYLPKTAGVRYTKAGVDCIIIREGKLLCTKN